MSKKKKKVKVKKTNKSTNIGNLQPTTSPKAKESVLAKKQKATNEPKTKDKTKKILIFIIVLLLAIIIIGAILIISNYDKIFNPTVPIEPNGITYNNKTNESDETIAFAGFTSEILKFDSNDMLYLPNASANKGVDMVYELSYKNEVIFTSQPIAPGQQGIIRLSRLFEEPGQYTITINMKATKGDKIYSQMNQNFTFELVE